MKLKYLPFLILVSCITIFPQSLTVEGKVEDKSTNKPLENANVILTRVSDSKIFGMTTNKDGSFLFNNLSRGKYNLSITFVGYSIYKNDIEIQNASLNLQTLFLTPVGVKLKPVEVTADPTPIVLKSDTTEYNAGAFKVNKDALAEDLITKMPGITVQNGTVQAQGENVQKVLVDGREFFGSDPNAVLKNLPAEVIEKIQVFDQQSDQAQFTGFDDGNTNKTINIVTRFQNRQGTFGRFTGGYGNDTRYAAGGNINFFNKDQRISILAQINNVNQQNFSTDDLLGVMSGSGRMVRIGGGNRPMSGRRVGGGNFGPGGGFGGNSVSNFLVNQSTGLIQTKAFGINYSDKWGEKVDLTGSYFFNLTNNDAESNTNRDYFLTSPTSQNYNELNSSITQNINHRFNLRLNYQIDRDNSILFNPTIAAQLNNGSSNISGITTSGTDKLNSTNNLFNSNLTGLTSTNNLLFRHRFDIPGRTLSINFTGTFNKNSGNNNLNAQDIFYNSSTTSDTINQFSNLDKHGFSGGSNIVYTEPITESSLLQFNARFNYSEDNSDQKTFDNLNNQSPYLDTSLSNVYKKIYRTQSVGTGYRFRKNNIIFNANLNYNIAELQNSQSFPQFGNIGRTFYSWLPSFMMRYIISRNENLRIFYRTNNNDPSIDQLQQVLNNTNPTQLSIGNPDLSQDYSHFIAIRYLQTNAQHMHTFFILFSANLIENYIGNNTILATKDTTVLNNILLNRGTKLSIPTNLDGYINLHSFVTYGVPVEFIKSNVNLNLSASYTRTPGIINGITNYANSSTYGLGVVISSNISDKIDFTVSSNSSYNVVNNSGQLDNTPNNNYFSQNSTIKFYWQFWNGFVLQNEVNNQLNNGLPASYSPSTIIWNVSIAKKFLGNDNGEIKISANDVLNQNTNISHNVSDSYVEDERTNVLGRYFLLSFVYNIRAF
ncbi:MAG: TonB dependent receptor [Bacteroidetes bacterium]|nr:TonB dependent receptor [Bacteroidota bacterium]